MSEVLVYKTNFLGLTPCHHGNYIGGCPHCVREQAGAITEGLRYGAWH